MKTIFWNVKLNGKLIDMVPFTTDCDKDYVYRALVNHDGYDHNIVLSKNRSRGKKAKYNFKLNNSIYFTKELTPKQAIKELENFYSYVSANINSPLPTKLSYELAE